MPAPKGNKFAVGSPGGGRVSTYRPEYVKRAEKACEAGFTDRELGELFGVTEMTINNWKLEHEDFALALKRGKAPADQRVERSLYHRAVGYRFEAVKIFMPAGADAPVYASYEEHVPPDTTAAIFWLKNRRPDQWRDVNRTEISGPDGTPIVIKGGLPD